MSSSSTPEQHGAAHPVKNDARAASELRNDHPASHPEPDSGPAQVLSGSEIEAAGGKKRLSRRTGGSEAGKMTWRGTKSTLRKLGVALGVLWTIMCLVIGVLLGWMANERIQVGRTTAGPSVIEVPVLEEVPSFAMPDLRGLSLPEAKQVIVDTGASADVVEVVEVEWGGAPGLVIAQDPVLGEQVASRIQLQVSKQATMPEVAGLAESEAVDRLRLLGVEAVVEQRFDLSARTGTVLEASVAVGEALPKVVNLVVAQPGAAVFVSQLKSVDGNCSKHDGRINGQSYPNSTECRSGTAEHPSTSVWLLDRKAHQLSAVVGVDDRGKTDASVTVRITGDGKELANVNATYATPTEVSVSVEGVLRLEIIVVSENRASAVFGDMLVKGLPDEIKTLEIR